jgi:hypothetical protein
LGIFTRLEWKTEEVDGEEMEEIFVDETSHKL